MNPANIFWANPVTFVNSLDKTSLVAQLVKNPPAMQETPLRLLGREDPLEEG